jgi:molecular chaperone GrpE
VRKRKAKRQVDDGQVNNDTSRAPEAPEPEPDNPIGARAESRSEATENEAAEAAASNDNARTDAEPGGPEDAEPVGDDAGEGATATSEQAAAEDNGGVSAAAEPVEGEVPAAAEVEAEGVEPVAEEGDVVEAELVEEPGEQAEDAEPVAEEDPQEAVMADLVAARAEAESYLDDLRRLQAEFDNYRKRTMREQTARIASASQALVAKLLPVLDNFELAVSHAEQSRDFDRMLKGVEMVFGELREVLSSEGLVTIEAEGKPFDPERHEAVVAVEQDGADTGTVVDVIRKGYEFNGRVLRPAMVKVAR